MFVADGVRVVLGSGAVGDNEDLDVVIEAGICPEGVFLVAANLVEGFLNFDPAAFEFYVDEG